MWKNETSCIKQSDQTYGKHKNKAQHRKILAVITKKANEVFLCSVLRECRRNDLKCNLVECTVNQATINNKELFYSHHTHFWQLLCWTTKRATPVLASVFISFIAFRLFSHRHSSWFISDSPKKSEQINCVLFVSSDICIASNWKDGVRN